MQSAMVMNRKLVTSLLCASAIVSQAADAAATSFEMNDDNAVVALDARTGERRWAYYPERLTQATCERGARAAGDARLPPPGLCVLVPERREIELDRVKRLGPHRHVAVERGDEQPFPPEQAEDLEGPELGVGEP